MKPALKMTDEEFADFRQNVILPMIHRHHEMFPGTARAFQANIQRGRCRVLANEEAPRNGSQCSLPVWKWTQIQVLLRRA